ncbi:MFS transporter [Alloscardovia venturai]|uniref:MFS transporter n=1 Tax=Alloscardovia venturai TaxID=1769421 RepID=A0ABW2Y573_9BIFI
MAHLLLAVIYLAFISLGLPDSLMGSAWPTMYTQFHVPLAFAGIVQIIITAGTVVSALLSDRLTYHLGAAKVTLISVVMTAAALFGFSVSPNFWVLCLVAIPYGLGAGAIDAALNNYVALHYSGSVMNWLHAMWGVGTVVSPAIMSYALNQQHRWQNGYLYVSLIQSIIAFIVLLSIPLWVNRSKARSDTNVDLAGHEQIQPRGLMSTLRLDMAREVLFMFFCYCAVESTAMLWSSSYVVFSRGLEKSSAAQWAMFFFIGMTVGRIVSGFVAAKMNDMQLIQAGIILAIMGIIIIIPLHTPQYVTACGLVIMGLGSAPIYPSIIHSTPRIFGEENSQAMVGVQMASAYIGSLIAPPVFGLIAQLSSVLAFPYYALAFYGVVAVMFGVVKHRLKTATYETHMR